LEAIKISKAILAKRTPIHDSLGSSRRAAINLKKQTQTLNNLEGKLSEPTSYPAYLTGDKTFKKLDPASNFTNPPLGVANGGTGATSFTSGNIVTSGTSNNAPFTTRALSDSTSASALGTSTNLVTTRDLYYGLPWFNDSSVPNSGTVLYAPISSRSGYFVRSPGSGAPGLYSSPRETINITYNSGWSRNWSQAFRVGLMVSIKGVFLSSNAISEAVTYMVGTISSSVNRPPVNMQFPAAVIFGYVNYIARASMLITTGGVIECVGTRNSDSGPISGAYNGFLCYASYNASG
jgi:hypothetical protein